MLQKVLSNTKFLPILSEHTVDPFTHRMRYLGTGRIEGVVDVKPDDHAGILQRYFGHNEYDSAEFSTPSKIPFADMIVGVSLRVGILTVASSILPILMCKSQRDNISGI